jgi:3-oxoacyl-(acyl-carrier-protein) synthase
MGESAARPRIVVTGLGVVSAAGWGVAPFAQATREGRTEIRAFSRFDHGRQRTHVAGEVPDGPPDGIGRDPRFARLSFAERFAVFAAREAVAQAGLEEPLEQAGVFFGSSTGGLLETEWFLEELWRTPGSRGRLRLIAGHQLNAPGDAVARWFGAGGPVESISSACASAALAVESALRALARGDAPLALAGGSDELCQLTYSGFNSLRAVDETPCRPFSADRLGMSLGEGAAVLVLEPLPLALARGARPLAELRGAGASCDAHHMTAPHPQGVGASLAIEAGLLDAGDEAERVSYVNAHGTGTPLNDTAESAAFRTVFGERASRIPVSATKGLVGHLLGASGAIEAAATVLCLQSRCAHPSAAQTRADPALGLDLVVDAPRPLPERATAVSTSLGFGGANAALVFSAWNES